MNIIQEVAQKLAAGEAVSTSKAERFIIWVKRMPLDRMREALADFNRKQKQWIIYQNEEILEEYRVLVNKEFSSNADGLKRLLRNEANKKVILDSIQSQSSYLKNSYYYIPRASLTKLITKLEEELLTASVA